MQKRGNLRGGGVTIGRGTTGRHAFNITIRRTKDYLLMAGTTIRTQYTTKGTQQDTDTVEQQSRTHARYPQGTYVHAPTPKHAQTKTCTNYNSRAPKAPRYQPPRRAPPTIVAVPNILNPGAAFRGQDLPGKTSGLPSIRGAIAASTLNGARSRSSMSTQVQAAAKAAAARDGAPGRQANSPGTPVPACAPRK